MAWQTCKPKLIWKKTDKSFNLKCIFPILWQKISSGNRRTELIMLLSPHLALRLMGIFGSRENEQYSNTACTKAVWQNKQRTFIGPYSYSKSVFNKQITWFIYIKLNKKFLKSQWQMWLTDWAKFQLMLIYYITYIL